MFSSKNNLALLAIMSTTSYAYAQNELQVFSVFDVDQSGSVDVADVIQVANSSLRQDNPAKTNTGEPAVISIAQLSALLQSINKKLDENNEKLSIMMSQMNHSCNCNCCGVDKYEYVDLGLESGLLWASCNVGATKPEEYGSYFIWGETVPSYTPDGTTKFFEGKAEQYRDLMSKYTTHDNYSSTGIADDLTVLEAIDDAASVLWGGLWRTPTVEEVTELVNSCTWNWTSINEIKGYEVVGPNGATIFLPATGNSLWQDEEVVGINENACYWTSTLYGQASFDGDNYSYGLYFTSGSIWPDRKVGRISDIHCIRPVKNSSVAK